MPTVSPSRVPLRDGEFRKEAASPMDAEPPFPLLRALLVLIDPVPPVPPVIEDALEDRVP